MRWLKKKRGYKTVGMSRGLTKELRKAGFLQ